MAQHAFLRFGLAHLLLAAFTALATAQESAQVAKGKGLYDQHCALCHGADGKQGDGFQTPIWGEGSFIASKFGNARALIEYLQIMPFNDPTLIDDSQRLDVTAYLLANHGAIPRSGGITQQNASGIPIK